LIKLKDMHDIWNKQQEIKTIKYIYAKKYDFWEELK
jgi:hypothetical protein